MRGKNLIIVLCAVALFVPIAAEAQNTGGIGGRVAQSDSDNPRAHSIFIYELKHGETTRDQLLVLNQTDKQQDIIIGSVDAIASATGEFACREEVEPKQGSGSWVNLSTDRITLAAESEALVDFTVTVPEKADVGEHNSCLTVRQADDEGEDAGGGIQIYTRQAVRMITTIPGELHREVSLKDFSARQAATGEAYSLSVSNKGNVSVDVDMQIILRSAFGREVAATGGEYPILPDETMHKEFTSSHRPMLGGWYSATPSIRYDTRLGAFGTQTEGADYKTITGETVGVFLWPTLSGWATIVGAVTSLVVGFILLFSHLREKELLRKNARPYRVKPRDTLQSVSKKADANWRDVVTLNKLKAPYSLTSGEEILLPAPRVSHTKKASKPKQKKG